MRTEIAVAIITGLLSGAVFSFLQFIITRSDGRQQWRKKVEDRLEKIEEQQEKSEKDALRMQLLFLMYVTPEAKEEILQLADYYFRVLKADFYLTPLFQKWLITHGMEIPSWFAGE